jgi:hypothetical protein
MVGVHTFCADRDWRKKITKSLKKQSIGLLPFPKTTGRCFCCPPGTTKSPCQAMTTWSGPWLRGPLSRLGGQQDPQGRLACSIPPPPKSPIKSSSPATAAATHPAHHPSCSSQPSSNAYSSRTPGLATPDSRDTPSTPRPHLQSFAVFFPSVAGWSVKMWYETTPNPTPPLLCSVCCRRRGSRHEKTDF